MQKPEWPDVFYFVPKNQVLPFRQMNPQSADSHSSLRHFLYQPGIQQAAQEEWDEPKQMLPTEKSKDERFEIYERAALGLEINSRDFVARVERQAHRQLATLAMQPERDPS